MLAHLIVVDRCRVGMRLLLVLVMVVVAIGAGAGARVMVMMAEQLAVVLINWRLLLLRLLIHVVQVDACQCRIFVNYWIGRTIDLLAGSQHKQLFFSIVDNVGQLTTTPTSAPATCIVTNLGCLIAVTVLLMLV